MKKILLLCFICMCFSGSLFAKRLATFPEMSKPIELRVDAEHIYVSRQSTLFIYTKNNFQLVKKLCQKGEGPEEFKSHMRITFNEDQLVLYDSSKIILYTRDFKLIRELNLPSRVDRIAPSGANFVLTHAARFIDNKKYKDFTLYNDRLEKMTALVTEPVNPDSHKYLLPPRSRCRSFGKRIFIAQPSKGFCIDVFDEEGKNLYRIEKKLPKIKSAEKHKKLLLEEYSFFLGKRLYQKAKGKGALKKALREFLPDIHNFWVDNTCIFVKTHDITDSKEKYIVMDHKGTILKSIFLPKTYMEILAFYGNTFYYLEENEENESWTLNAVTF